MINYIIVGLGGFTGAIGRYLMGTLPFSTNTFPGNTLLINFIGSLAIGFFSCALGNNSPKLSLFITVGVCGGFTTFSTFSLEVVKLLEGGKIPQGVIYIAASLVLCISGVLIGRYFASVTH